MRRLRLWWLGIRREQAQQDANLHERAWLLARMRGDTGSAAAGREARATRAKGGVMRRLREWWRGVQRRKRFAPKPMTTRDLWAIEGRLHSGAWPPGGVRADMSALVAEVRRLRGGAK